MLGVIEYLVVACVVRAWCNTNGTHQETTRRYSASSWCMCVTMNETNHQPIDHVLSRCQSKATCTTCQISWTHDVLTVPNSLAFLLETLAATQLDRYHWYLCRSNKYGSSGQTQLGLICSTSITYQSLTDKVCKWTLYYTDTAREYASLHVHVTEQLIMALHI